MARRAIFVVLDSVGAGASPDAAQYGDAGAHTLAHVATAAGGLDVPNLQALGLGNLTQIPGVAPVTAPTAAFGKMQEASAGKDTTTGHWEFAGLRVDTAFPTYPHGFPPEILDPFIARTGRGVLGNRTASGTEILDELGEEHMRTGKLIVYTSADSVFQIAAHEDIVPPEELYRYSQIARDILDPFQVGRVIARPFVGTGKGSFQRTYNRRDFSLVPPAKTVLDHIKSLGLPVVGIGKISDIYAGRGITQDIHTEGNADGMVKIAQAMDDTPSGLIFCNLVDFDMLYGHRRDAAGYRRCLEEFDAALPSLLSRLRPDDLLFLSADHGNDPTTAGTDHTREYVPLLVIGPRCKAGVDLGVRRTFADLGATVAAHLGAAPPPTGTSFLSEITP